MKPIIYETAVPLSLALLGFAVKDVNLLITAGAFAFCFLVFRLVGSRS
jgi:hypothetical protein